ncbi:MAG: hypothetical protein R3362_03320, partial [Rhodothermales bacterium]|nr:hypothetical protein [Rhodothermales bacterium]
VLRLADLGVVPGDELRLERLGEFQYEGQDDVTLVRYRLLAVFSASDAVRPTAERERVEGALDAGSDYVSMASHNDDLDTDIPEDFLVAGDGATTQVRVPERAAFLLFSPDDDYFADNLDEDADYRVCVTRLP